MSRAATLSALVLSAALVSTTACTQVNLAQALQVTDVFTGFYDAGIKDGWNYLKPSISFKLKNVTSEPIDPAQVTVSFWKEGADGEWDSHLIQAIRSDGLAPGASTDTLVARTPTVGFRLEGARADFFQHSLFTDITARIFATQAGKIYPLGQYKLDRVIIPNAE